MTRLKLNYIIDLLAAISFLLVAKSGLIIMFFLPEGVRRGGYQEFLGISKKTYISIHDWSGVVFIVLVIIHFILHWKWLVCTTKSFFVKKIENNKTEADVNHKCDEA